MDNADRELLARVLKEIRVYHWQTRIDLPEPPNPPKLEDLPVFDHSGSDLELNLRLRKEHFLYKYERNRYENLMIALAERYLGAIRIGDVPTRDLIGTAMLTLSELTDLTKFQLLVDVQ